SSGRAPALCLVGYLCRVVSSMKTVGSALADFDYSVEAANRVEPVSHRQIVIDCRHVDRLICAIERECRPDNFSLGGQVKIVWPDQLEDLGDIGPVLHDLTRKAPLSFRDVRGY